MSETKFNRAKFKDTVSSEELKAIDKSVEDIVRVKRDGNYASFLSIENGINKFALFPSHESILQMVEGNEDMKNEPFVVPKQTYWLPREVDDLDDQGNVKKDKRGNTIKKVITKTVFDGRIHSDSKKDPVDFYIKILKAKLDEEYQDDAKVKEIMYHIYGDYQRKIKGIVGKPTWIMYAQKLTGNTMQFGRLEVTKAVKMRINEIIAIEESNGPIGSESNNPLTDIELRRALIVKYNDKAQKANDYYITEIDSDIDKDPSSPTYKQVKFYPLSDSDLEEFLKYPSLSSLYKDVYTQKDFDLAVQGLELFDNEHEFNVFSDDEFMEELSEMRNLFPEPKEEEEIEVENSEEEVDEFESMDRNELKKYAKNNKTGIVIIQSMSDDDIRNKLRTWAESTTVEEEQNQEEEVEESEEEESNKKFAEILDSKPSAPGVKHSNAKERIAAIRNKVSKK